MFQKYLNRAASNAEQITKVNACSNCGYDLIGSINDVDFLRTSLFVVKALSECNFENPEYPMHELRKTIHSALSVCQCSECGTTSQTDSGLPFLGATERQLMEAIGEAKIKETRAQFRLLESIEVGNGPVITSDRLLLWLSLGEELGGFSWYNQAKEQLKTCSHSLDFNQAALLKEIAGLARARKIFIYNLASESLLKKLQDQIMPW